MGVPMRDIEEKDEKVDRRIWRVFASMAAAPDFAGATGSDASVADERLLKEHTEAVLHEIARKRGGVVLGRAGAIVLAGVPNALHVRLDGPLDARIAVHARLAKLDEKTAARDVRDNDSARHGYVKHFYRKDATDPRFYHLMIDTTVLRWPVVASIIATAARARGV